MQKTELCPQIFERVLDRRTGKCNPVLALQLDDRTESKGIIVLDILTLIKYDLFECVGAENINVIPHHPISREYQMEMIEELLRMSFGKRGVAVIFRYRKSREAFSLSSPVVEQGGGDNDQSGRLTVVLSVFLSVIIFFRSVFLSDFPCVRQQLIFGGKRE